jgi:LCP family protein required for cell wall assembly
MSLFARRRKRTRRFLTIRALLPLGIAVLLFSVVTSTWSTPTGMMVSGAAAGLVAGLGWLILGRRYQRRRLAPVADTVRLGNISTYTDSPSPTLVDPDSSTAGEYREIARRLEAETTGQILQVAGVSPGIGSTTVAMNLAFAMTLDDRRVILVDGDMSRRGLSRFVHTGASPGLAELARGESDLARSARLWAVGPRKRLPMVPAGDIGDDETILGSATVAAALDQISDGTDLILVDVPPAFWSHVDTGIGSHADGTVLVINEHTTAAALENATRAHQESGAPVVGYISRSARKPSGRVTWRGMALRSIATAVLILAGFSAWTGYQAFRTWNGRQTVVNDLAAAADLLEPLPADALELPELDEVVIPPVSSPPTDSTEFTSYLIVGTDESEKRADVVVLLLDPNDGSTPAMVSLPRDLYLPNRCRQNYTRINVTFFGCRDEINGPTLLALTVSDFTGIPVDHFALFTFDGFEEIVDELGGIEICTENPVRDRKADLNLPGGCTLASGEQALAWVRSRSTQELVNGVWRTMPGVTDLTRNQRQQEMVLALFSKAKNFSSVSELMGTVRGLSNAFTLDDQLSLPDAVRLAWGFRSTNLEEIHRLSIPVKDYTVDNADGTVKYVLLPTRSFEEILNEAYPDRISKALS